MQMLAHGNEIVLNVIWLISAIEALSKPFVGVTAVGGCCRGNSAMAARKGIN